MRLSSGVRRHRVVTRAKVRGQRARKAAAVAAVAVLGGLAAATVRQLRRDAGAGLPAASMRARLVPAVADIKIEGAPEALGAKLAAFLVDPDGRPSRFDRSAELLAAFPCLASAKSSRRWFARELVYSVKLKRAVARTADGRYLADDGSVFAAEPGLELPAGPTLDVGQALKDDLRSFVVFMQELDRASAVPSKLSRARYTGPWELEFEDGTRVLLSDLRWTDEKLSRLREVLADGRGQAPAGGPFSVDLRYFEDGRILLKPMAVQRAGAKL